MTETGMTTGSATLHRWADIPPEAINASIGRQYLTADRVTIARFELKRGGVVPRHAHVNEQVSCVLSGALTFRFDDRELIARAGDVVQIPGGIPHEVTVVEDAVVLDVFSPVRQDWIDRTDTYFVR